MLGPSSLLLLFAAGANEITDSMLGYQKKPMLIGRRKKTSSLWREEDRPNRVRHAIQHCHCEEQKEPTYVLWTRSTSLHLTLANPCQSKNGLVASDAIKKENSKKGVEQPVSRQRRPLVSSTSNAVITPRDGQSEHLSIVTNRGNVMLTLSLATFTW